MPDPGDLNDIRLFVVAARQGSLSAAARELRQPVSTLSRALTRLEKHFGLLLVRRGARGLVLTEAGQQYLAACKRALHSLREAAARIEESRSNPSGIVKVACPVTMARDVVMPLFPEFHALYPDLRLEIEVYCSDFDQEPREDVDIFFKVRAPKDSLRNVRSFPDAARGLFATSSYLSRAGGAPEIPDDLPAHACTGFGSWKFSKGQRTAEPAIPFLLVSSDFYVNMQFVQQGLGIGNLPLYMAAWPENSGQFVRVLPLWKSEPMTLSALYTGHSRFTPKVQVLLEYLIRYIGTDRDPRLRGAPAMGMFASLICKSENPNQR